MPTYKVYRYLDNHNWTYPNLPGKEEVLYIFNHTDGLGEGGPFDFAEETDPAPNYYLIDLSDPGTPHWLRRRGPT